MPRLSLYRPEKTKDFKFFDRTIYEMFQVGGVDVYIHKYIGTVSIDANGNTVAKDATQIQDMLFLENRDRKYDQDIYTLRGHYQTADTDFNLSQFGLFLSNDTVFMTVHINNSVDLLGRKIMAGDVFELPNLREEYFLETGLNYLKAIKKFYVVEEINRAAEGYSATWYPHLYRVKLKPMTDSQEFADILSQPENMDTYAGDFDSDKVYYPGQVVKYQSDLFTVIDAVGAAGTSIQPPNTSAWLAAAGNSLRDLLSTYNKSLEINNAVVLEAETDAPLSGYETSHFYNLAVDPNTGRSLLSTVDDTIDNIADFDGYVSAVNAPPVRDGYKGYLLENGVPTNGNVSSDAQFGFGIQFPIGAVVGDSFLRTDYMPNRLFRWDGIRWVKQEDNVRMTMTNTDTRQTLKTSFINNNEISGIDKAGTDTIKVDMLGGNTFDTGGITTDFAVLADSVYIATSLDYNVNFKVEVWVNESSKALAVTNQNISGKFAFTINHQIADGSRIRYTVYSTYVTQRQSLSKALKPTADN